jgi:hypothetical protein
MGDFRLAAFRQLAGKCTVKHLSPKRSGDTGEYGPLLTPAGWRTTVTQCVFFRVVALRVRSSGDVMQSEKTARSRQRRVNTFAEDTDSSSQKQGELIRSLR